MMLKTKYFGLNGRQVFSLAVNKLIKIFERANIKGLGKAVSVRDMFVYRPGSVPVLLVAHVDCVLPHPNKGEVMQYHNLIYSEGGHLGGDDRAGVLAIFELLRLGYRPHVLFTNYEETGGIGADMAAEYLKDTIEKANIRYIIELDRRGDNDACFYGDTNEEFQAFIESYGFKTAHGSFSDISILCPAWKISGVNLSIGYHNAHTSRDFLHVTALQDTIKRVGKMLDINAPRYEYKEKVYSWTFSKMFGPVDISGMYSEFDEPARKKWPHGKRNSKYYDPFYYRDGLSWDYEGSTEDGSIYDVLRDIDSEFVTGTIGPKKAN